MATPLVAMHQLALVPHYYDQGLDGAARSCYVAEPVAERLLVAAAGLRSLSAPQCRFALLLWDGHRPLVTQQRLFNDYVEELIRTQRVSRSSAEREAARFVSPPGGIYPHGTGGAVDLTLLVNDSEAEMGTGFDAFEDAAAADWYRRTEPVTPKEYTAALNRERLRFAMVQAGFVPHPEEWWHYEWGTARWGAALGRPAILTEILVNPQVAVA
jgi:zinc D-Ala-D-Ala dipeptidase